MPSLSELADTDELKDENGEVQTSGQTNVSGEHDYAGSEPEEESSPGIHTPSEEEAKKARRRTPAGAGAAHAELIRLREQLERLLNLDPERGESATSAIEGLQSDIKAATDIILQMQDPQALQDIDGVGPKTAEKIAEWARGL